TRHAIEEFGEIKSIWDCVRLVVYLKNRSESMMQSVLRMKNVTPTHGSVKDQLQAHLRQKIAPLCTQSDLLLWLAQIDLDYQSRSSSGDSFRHSSENSGNVFSNFAGLARKISSSSSKLRA
ncbi:MAG: hypothetical protein KDA72_23090, partial [Planctomycetales bacterium]|nr:hypothetical protein [Planctomycetales bacterium]